MPAKSRVELTIDRVLERMKEAYLQETAEIEKENGPTEHELFEEYRAAVLSDDPQALSNLIGLRGQESFDKQAAKGISVTRRQMLGR